jgi:hypothetical protein
MVLLLALVLILGLGLALSWRVRPPEGDCLLTGARSEPETWREKSQHAEVKGIGFLFCELQKTNPELIDHTEQGEPRLLLTPEAKQRVASFVVQANLTDEVRTKIGYALLCGDAIVWTDGFVLAPRGEPSGDRLVSVFVRMLPSQYADRYAEEWAAEWAIIPDGMTRAKFIYGLFWASIKIRLFARRSAKSTR